MQDAAYIVQPFQRPGATGGIFQYVFHAGLFNQRCRQRIKMNVGPGCVCLNHCGISEPVNHHSRQSIGFSVDQPIIRSIIQLITKLESPVDMAFKPALVHLSLGVLVQHPTKYL